ncbi:MAG: lysophospholipid acyltransferase family protein [candidate division WOR-3 bacterium]
MNFSSLLKSRWFLLLARYILILIVPLYFLTLRVTELGRSNFERVKGPCVFVLWHNRFFPLVWLHRKSGIYIMVSPSRDGDFIAKILEFFGFCTVRTSMFKRKIGGLKDVVRILSNGERLAVLVDGPRGPRYSVPEGFVNFVKKLNVPLVPLTVEYNRFIEFNSWDRFRLPLPFSKVFVAYGESFIPKTVNELRDKLFELEHAVRSRI